MSHSMTGWSKYFARLSINPSPGSCAWVDVKISSTGWGHVTWDHFSRAPIEAQNFELLSAIILDWGTNYRNWAQVQNPKNLLYKIQPKNWNRKSTTPPLNKTFSETKIFWDKEQLGVVSVIGQLRWLAWTSDLLIWNWALFGSECSTGPANNEHVLAVVNCIVSVPTTHETAGIGPLSRFNVKSTDCFLACKRSSTKQVKRVADVDDRGINDKLVIFIFVMLGDLYRG